MTKAEKILVQKRNIVWKVIQGYLHDPVFPTAFRIKRKYQKEYRMHWRIVREYPERKGKYLRPTLVVLTTAAIGGSEKDAYTTAAAMQVSEDWILNHDDFEDDSLFRRGKPALHKIFGPELAINAGDTLHVIMWRILYDNYKILGQDKASQIIQEFFRMLMRATFGQSIEIIWTKENRLNFTDNDWFFIADGKTAYYTIAGPMRLGAIVAGAGEKELNQLAEFGIYLGRAFQLVDDILDVTSDFKGLKKQKGNDIYEGKRTVLLGHLLRVANKKDQKRLQAILAKNRQQKSEQEVEWVIEKMHSYGSVEYAQKLSFRLYKKAMTMFADFQFLQQEPYRTQIESLAKFIVEREY